MRAVVHYLALRLGLQLGRRKMEFSLENGFLRQSAFNQGPVRNTELEAMGRREAP